jgi:hypothetical protein
VRLVYRVEVEAPPEMKPLFETLIKDVTEMALKALVKQMSGASCQARFTRE